MKVVTTLMAMLGALALTAGAATQSAAAPERTRTYELQNGWWFDDSVFVRRTMYVEGRTFRTRRPRTVDSVVNLAGQFVIPPFTDAHTHAFGNPATITATVQSHLDQGVFYALSLLNPSSTKSRILPHVNRPDAVDVAFADAGVTGVRGHPILTEEMAANGWRWDSLGAYWPRLLRSRKADGDSYVVVDSIADIARQLPRVLASRPDVIKIFLLESERFAAKRADTTALGANGLDPAVVPALVAAAHRSGRRVAAHVETAADFRVAITAGVDIIAHLPGVAIRSAADSVAAAIDPADAARAARQRVVVIPTAWLASQGRISRGDTAQVARTRRLQRRNLALLHGAGVAIAVGSDLFATSAVEAKALLALEVFTAADVLRMWTTTSAQLAFPNRRIGRLEVGAEGSLLVLRCDPLVSFTCTDSISLRMKQGRILTARRDTMTAAARRF